MMTCRDEVLAAFHGLTRRTGRNVFAITDILKYMKEQGTGHAESTIRTHITSRMCANAPDNHGTTYSDLIRIGRGLYRLA